MISGSSGHYRLSANNCSQYKSILHVEETNFRKLEKLKKLLISYLFV